MHYFFISLVVVLMLVCISIYLPFDIKLQASLGPPPSQSQDSGALIDLSDTSPANAAPGPPPAYQPSPAAAATSLTQQLAGLGEQGGHPSLLSNCSLFILITFFVNKFYKLEFVLYFKGEF